jgi:hypothetical protein
MLVLAAASLLAMAYALTQGELWSAAVGAFGVFLMLRFYRNEKQLEQRP